MNHQSAYCINERPESITLTSLSNLVKLHGTPDVGKVYHKTPTSSKPLSRSQRYCLCVPTTRLGSAVLSAPLRSNAEGVDCNNGISLCARLYRLYMALRVQESEMNCHFSAGVSLCPDTR